MGTWSTHGRGRYAPSAPGEADVVLLPAGFRQDGTVPGIVYCHGAAGDALSVSDPIQRAGEWALLHGLAEHYPIVAADLGGPFTFGNATALARIEDARRYLQDTWGARPGPVAVVGVSMGGVGALNYAAAHRDHVSAAVGVVPVTDLNELYQGHSGIYTPYIAAAWGLAVGQALPLLANPVNHVLELLGLPYQAWYASDDDVVPATTVRNLLGLLGLTGEGHDVGRLGHTQAAIGAASVPAILTFLDAHLTIG